LEDAGIFALVLELLPEDVAAGITEALSIPTIGIGAGMHCDGQVLVLHDLLGITSKIHPRFVKQYATVGEIIRKATEQYAQEVRAGQFPGPEHVFPPEERLTPTLVETVAKTDSTVLLLGETGTGNCPELQREPRPKVGMRS
jgi:3-methyl-2-oxobutanoate hydroxymethyltransferase